MLKRPSCPECVGGVKKCIHCSGRCIKHGTVRSKQRYRCTQCHKTFVESYCYKAYDVVISKLIPRLVCTGSSLRKIAESLEISKDTVLHRIRRISATINKPTTIPHQVYEVDEMATFIGKKSHQVYVAYVLNHDTREVLDFSIGTRSNATLEPLADAVKAMNPKRIYTDKLVNYKKLFEGYDHRTTKRGTNRIERKNLSIRTHLKRLSRKTICFSRSVAMLSACLTIYFWGT